MKYLKWAGALIAFVFGMFLVSNARRNEQRGDALIEKQKRELAKEKNANLAKADKLGKAAEKKFDKAAATKTAGEARAKKLEKKDATPLADRMRRFNDGLRDKSGA